MRKDKPKIRKYNKKLKKIEDEETILKLEEELIYKNIQKIQKW